MVELGTFDKDFAGVVGREVPCSVGGLVEVDNILVVLIGGDLVGIVGTWWVLGCVAVGALDGDFPWQGCSMMMSEYSLLLDIPCLFDCFVVAVVL